MRRAVDPATLVVCATLPQALRRAACGQLIDGLGSGPMATWAADADTLAAVTEVVRSRGGAGPELAAVIQPAWLDSRVTLRRMIAAARQAAGVETAVLRGPRPLAHHAVLAEEGIRVVAVDTPAAADRGSRRPAPAGWRCRNPVWGLWEVQVDPPARAGILGWLMHGSMPRLRRGALHVLHAGGVPAERPVSGRLERWLAWAGRRQAGGRVRTVGLSELPALVARAGQPPVSGSVLKAA